MAKDTYIVSVGGCIKYKGEDHLPTSPAFACETKEAKRLIEMVVAALATKPATAAPGKTADQLALDEAAAAKIELLKQIASAATIEDLTTLIPDEEPEADIQNAVEARMAELEAGA